MWQGRYGEGNSPAGGWCCASYDAARVPTAARLSANAVAYMVVCPDLCGPKHPTLHGFYFFPAAASKPETRADFATIGVPHYFKNDG